MKSFNQFLSESVTINGDFNGTLNIGGQPEPQQVGEEFIADLVWKGQLYRMEMTSKDGIPSREQLAEHLQKEYPGVIVQQIYPVHEQESTFNIKDSKRYHYAKLDWV
ncbi:hypothetical protein [Synechococcus phage DSL-LC03]|nr:hypothetical protein [Synechococcus phage DSL-LC03]